MRAASAFALILPQALLFSWWRIRGRAHHHHADLALRHRCPFLAASRARGHATSKRGQSTNAKAVRLMIPLDDLDVHGPPPMAKTATERSRVLRELLRRRTCRISGLLRHLVRPLAVTSLRKNVR